MLGETRAAIANAAIPPAKHHVPNPQQATEKKCMFSPAASAPKMHAGGPKPNWRNNSQKLKPRISRVKGAKIFRNISGETMLARHVSMLGAMDGHWTPIQFSGDHRPRKSPGRRAESHCI